MTSYISSRRKSRRKLRRKSRRKLRRKTRRKLRRKTKRKYRKQGGTKKSRKKKKNRDKTREKKNIERNKEEMLKRRHRERNDPEKALRILNNMDSTAGRDGNVLAGFAVEPHYLMTPEDRRALSRTMLYNKRFGQKDESQFVDKARVAFMPIQGHPNIPTIGIGQQLFERNIRELIDCQGLNPNQDREVRRLAARLHLAALDNSELGLTLNPQPTTLQQRQAILQHLPPNQRVTTTGQNLPYPLQIMRKSRRHHIAATNDRYPNTANGDINETDNMFWPTTREQIFNFLKDIPTLEELAGFGL